MFFGVLGYDKPISEDLFDRLFEKLEKASELKPDYLNVLNSVRKDFLRSEAEKYEKSPIIFTLNEIVTKEMEGCLKVFEKAEELYNSGKTENMYDELKKISEEYSLLIEFDRNLADMYKNISGNYEVRIFGTYAERVKFK